MEALESFKQNYHTENETPYISESVPVARKRSNGGRWKRGLVAAVAAIFILVIGNSITASALNFDLFAIIAKWTQETFHFGYAGQMDETNAPSPDFNNPCKSLQEALDNYDVSLPLVPTWIPDGYSEGKVRTTESPKQRLYNASYENGENIIIIRIADYLDSWPMQIEQSDTLLEIYDANGVDYYIFDNLNQLKVVWINENYECYISGPLSVEEIKSMVDSIGKG